MVFVGKKKSPTTMSQSWPPKYLAFSPEKNAAILHPFSSSCVLLLLRSTMSERDSSGDEREVRGVVVV
jgi:hypothetical protein